MWRQLSKPLAVVNDARDISTHINFSNKMVGTTINKRALEAIITAKRVQWLPVSKQKKTRIIRTAVLPKALYGCEAAPMSEAIMRKLQIAIAKCIGSPAARASNALTFTFCSFGDDLDPEAQQFVRRSVMLRRMCAKHGGTREQAETVRAQYAQQKYVGAYQEDQGLSLLLPSPPPGEPVRAKWKPQSPPKGPIGLLMCSTHLCAAAIKPGFNAAQEHESDVAILQD